MHTNKVIFDKEYQTITVSDLVLSDTDIWTGQCFHTSGRASLFHEEEQIHFSWSPPPSFSCQEINRQQK